jgi:hypothetical protein
MASDSLKLDFSDNIQATLSLTLSSGAYSVPGGNITALSLDIQPWGFSGEITFVVMAYPQTDALYTPFQAAATIPLVLTVGPGNEGSQQSSVVPMTLNGSVVSRSFTEVMANLETGTSVSSNPVLYRTYTIGFVDPLKHFWSQHFVQALYTNSTYQTVFSAQATSAFTLTYNWSLLTTSQNQIFVNTGINVPTGKPASFYDFLIWFVDQNNGYFYYNYSASNYVLASALPAAPTPIQVASQFVCGVEITLPEINYTQLSVINALSTSPSTQNGTNANAITPLARDYLTICTTPSLFTNEVTLQKARFPSPVATATWGYNALPSSMLVPGNAVQFQTTNDNWSAQSYLASQTLTVSRVQLRAVFDDRFGSVLDNYSATSAPYNINYTVTGLLPGTTNPLLPEYKAPVYPLQVQGLVYSTQGATGTNDYAFVQDSATSTNCYQVTIPLWNNQQVYVPYAPVNMNGQFYFPPYKNQQVLVNLWMGSASIDSYLDWLSYATLPMSGQGNAIVLGQSSTSQTSITHTYTNSIPQLNINRQQSTDTETISIGEGFILLQTEVTSS